MDCSFIMPKKGGRLEFKGDTTMAIFWDYNNGYIVRKNRRDAQYLYENGEAIMLLPNKANPDSPFNKPWHRVDNKGNIYAFIDSKKAWEIVGKSEHVRDFDSMVREFAYYNCGTELGNYVSFYVGVSA